MDKRRLKNDKRSLNNQRNITQDLESLCSDSLGFMVIDLHQMPHFLVHLDVFDRDYCQNTTRTYQGRLSDNAVLGL